MSNQDDEISRFTLWMKQLP